MYSFTHLYSQGLLSAYYEPSMYQALGNKNKHNTNLILRNALTI